MSITGAAGQGPVRAGIADRRPHARGSSARMGILTALLEREAYRRGPVGAHLAAEAQIAMLDFQAARWLVEGEVAGQAGNDHPTAIPTGVFPTADGHINIAASGDGDVERLCEALGRRRSAERSRTTTPTAASRGTAPRWTRRSRRSRDAADAPLGRRR